MPSEELRKKITLLAERKRVERLRDEATEVTFLGFATSEEMPSWIEDTIRSDRRIGSTPDAHLADTASSHEVDCWYEELIGAAGIGERFYCSTSMEHFPWADISPVGRNWVHSIRESLGSDISFVSHDFRSVITFLEEEHEYITFRHAEGRQTHP